MIIVLCIIGLPLGAVACFCLYCYYVGQSFAVIAPIEIGDKIPAKNIAYAAGKTFFMIGLFLVTIVAVFESAFI